MKKLGYLAVAFLSSSALFSSTASAQIADGSPAAAAPADKKIHYGAKAGLNLANIGGDDAPDESSMKLGLNVSGFVSYAINDMLAIQPELAFSQKGNTVEGEILGMSVEASSTLTYLELPILVAARFDAGSVTPRVFAGPTVGFLLSANATAEVAGEESSEDVKDQTSPFDLGIAAGAGVDIPMGPGAITVDARYNFGLMTVDDPEEGEAADVKNRTISILAGFRY